MTFARRAMGWPLFGLISCGLAVAANAQNWDFENGTLTGWTATGEAFRSQPTFDNNLTPRRPGEFPGQQGRWWVGTYEDRPSPAVPIGRVQGDEPQGSLLSPLFAIETLSIDFLIGGGNDIDRERVSLLVKVRPGDPPPGRPGMIARLPDGDYLIARSETGRNDENMRRAGWNVSTLLHHEARIQIVDNASGPWGHINADDFHGIADIWPTEADLPPDPSGPASGLGTAVVVTPGAPAAPVYVPPAGSGAGAAGAGGGVIVMPSGGARPTAVPVVSGPATAYPVESAPVTAYPVGGGAVTVGQPAPGAQVYQPTESIPQVARPLGGSLRPHARFRLVALEIDVLHQTRDDLIETDGPADEIQVRGNMFRYSRDGRLGDFETRWSGILGSEGHADFIAGTATPAFSPRADFGGLKTGDFYPMRPRGIQTNGDLPWIMWEGDLEEGGNGVVIVPSLWEIDSRGESDAQRAWERTIVEAARRSPQSVELAFTQPVEDRDSPINDRLIGNLPVRDDGNRPISAGEQAPFPYYIFLLPIPAPIGPLPHAGSIQVASIPLTYERARLFAARPASSIEIRTQRDQTGGQRPLPRGAMVMRLTDRASMEGDYLLILQLEEVS